MLLTAVGYTTATAFDEAVVNGIYNITVLVPMIGFGALAAVLIFLYPLNKNRVAENAEILAKKRAEQ